ncbi:MAG: hypothetical protein OJF58_002369 [Enhydrobacter sp.]|nr:MAG: hypothetical protein OJF58_002369 [Enhydrobacter sp.]
MICDHVARLTLFSIADRSTSQSIKQLRSVANTEAVNALSFCAA